MLSPVIRKSPIVIARNFAALQFCAGTLYYLAGTIGHYAQIWRGLPVADYVSFPIVQGAFIFLGEVALILYIFFHWHREVFRLSGGRLIHDEGVILRRHTAIPLERMASVTYSQGLIGRLGNYGTVTIKNAKNIKLFRETAMFEPKAFVARLTGYAAIADTDPVELIQSPEHERLEKKSTLRWDIKAQNVNRSLEKAVIKTVAAFMNSGGGHLLLGIGDNSTAVGIEHDLATLPRKDSDGWENHFSNVLSSMIKPSFRAYVTVSHFMHEAKACVLLTVAPTPEPVYLNDEDREEFYIRTGNRTVPLRMSEAHDYISSRFT
jgi:membrane protein YdbS with pleckstrin-like domain